MKLPIFARLTIGFFAIFLIMGAVNAYTVWKLHQVNKETARIISIDQRILDLKNKLADSVLSELAHDKKYIITKDPMFFDQLVSAANEFSKHLAEAISIADTTAKAESLGRVRSHHEKYQTLVREEVEQIRKGPAYPKIQYEKEKEKVIDQILEELKVLEASSHRDIYVRMSTLREAAGSAGTLAIIMLTIAFALVVGTSFLSTRSITKPLTALMDKTKEISKGVFEGELNIPSPPELSELTMAFNVMCYKLKRVDTMKSEFFSSMSHELRTPLASIKEGIGLLEEGVGGAMTDKQKRLLKILSEETHRLIGLVNSLLDVAKMEAGMMRYNFQQETLPPLIDKVLTEMGPLIEAKKLRVQADIEGDLPTLSLDRERMLQAIRNLVGNAAKFTPEQGQVTISVCRRDKGVEFSVNDTGLGIPKENLTAIFEKFHQPPVKTSEWVKGTGLGLAFVKHIITAHGGKVWAESKPGQGSTFIFVLPSRPVA
ncbi:MAG: Alkaline phosphatase synthesis sensor protein PhoR [Syntrophorhabdus sp. PtaU1.Bin153]|nr:MAG: Alkaline phosphatase synthesis sensor protein PhoR [Syntrophorhabdus sp. PtaU1.Bin153]